MSSIYIITSQSSFQSSFGKIQRLFSGSFWYVKERRVLTLKRESLLHGTNHSTMSDPIHSSNMQKTFQVSTPQFSNLMHFNYYICFGNFVVRAQLHDCSSCIRSRKEVEWYGHDIRVICGWLQRCHSSYEIQQALLILLVWIIRKLDSIFQRYATADLWCWVQETSKIFPNLQCWACRQWLPRKISAAQENI